MHTIIGKDSHPLSGYACPINYLRCKMGSFTKFGSLMKAAFVIGVIDKLFLVYVIMLFIRILSSWVPELQGKKFMQFVAYCTDPYLNVFRRFIPPLGMIDFSPIVAFLALGFFEGALKMLVAWILP